MNPLLIIIGAAAGIVLVYLLAMLGIPSGLVPLMIGAALGGIAGNFLLGPLARAYPKAGEFIVRVGMGLAFAALLAIGRDVDTSLEGPV